MNTKQGTWNAASNAAKEVFAGCTPKTRAGEHVPSLSESLRLSAPSHIYQQALQLETERDALRERERAWVKFAESVRDWYENAGNQDPNRESPGSHELWSAARAALTKARP